MTTGFFTFFKRGRHPITLWRHPALARQCSHRWAGKNQRTNQSRNGIAGQSKNKRLACRSDTKPEWLAWLERYLVKYLFDPQFLQDLGNQVQYAS